MSTNSKSLNPGHPPIPLTDLPELSAELHAIRQSGRGSPHLRLLVGALEELVQAAKDEGNPIVFV